MVDVQMRTLRETAHQARRQLDRIDRDVMAFAHRIPRLVDPGAMRRDQDHAAARGFRNGLMVGAMGSAAVALVLAPRRGSVARRKAMHAAAIAGANIREFIIPTVLAPGLRLHGGESENEIAATETDGSFLDLTTASTDPGAIAQTAPAAFSDESGLTEDLPSGSSTVR